jgi:acyl dehydratase
LAVGMTASFGTTLTAADVVMFAATTRMKTRVVHGMLTTFTGSAKV